MPRAKKTTKAAPESKPAPVAAPEPTRGVVEWVQAHGEKKMETVHVVVPAGSLKEGDEVLLAYA